MRAREGMPNVLFIEQDDTGFGQMGCYGSPIETPNVDNLAKNGLRFNNMHTSLRTVANNHSGNAILQRPSDSKSF